MDEAFESYVTQRDAMNLGIFGDELRACRASQELLNQPRPLVRRNRIPAEQIGENRLVVQRRGEQRREYQINLVIFQLGKFGDKECADGVACKTVSSKQVINDLWCQCASAFQLGSESFQ